MMVCELFNRPLLRWDNLRDWSYLIALLLNNGLGFWECIRDICICQYRFISVTSI
jgi:hypothetical protein